MQSNSSTIVLSKSNLHEFDPSKYDTQNFEVEDSRIKIYVRNRRVKVVLTDKETVYYDEVAGKKEETYKELIFLFLQKKISENLPFVIETKLTKSRRTHSWESHELETTLYSNSVENFNLDTIYEHFEMAKQIIFNETMREYEKYFEMFVRKVSRFSF